VSRAQDSTLAKPPLAKPPLTERAKAAARKSQGSPAYRAYLRYTTQRGSRLAAAITYFAFLSMFPLLAVAAGITAAVLGEPGVERLRHQIEQSLPGLGDKLDLDGLVAHAGTVGVISGVVLIWLGLAWVNAARGCLRTIWAVEDEPGGFVTRKLADLASLVGLGLAAAVSLGASALTTGLASRILRALGLENNATTHVLLSIFGVVIGIAASVVLFAYLLAGIPRLHVPHGILFRTALFAAAVFEVTKGLVAAYLGHVAGRSIYGAFGVPIALLVWFDLTFQMLLFLAAWTATRTEDALKA
jgi:membrane protein